MKALVSVAGHLLPSQLRPHHLTQITDDWKRLTPQTRYGYHQNLRKILRELQFSGAPPGLDLHVAKMPQPSPRAVTATQAERAALIAAAKPGLRLMILLCSDLALRHRTARNLAPCHYDRERRAIATNTKAGRVIMLPVTEQIAALLATCQHEGPQSSTPFVTMLGGPSCRDAINKQFRQLRQRLNIDRRITFHDLRRTTAYRTYEITKDLRLVQALLGHANLNTTLHYLDHHITTVPRELLEQVSANPKGFDA